MQMSNIWNKVYVCLWLLSYICFYSLWKNVLFSDKSDFVEQSFQVSQIFKTSFQSYLSVFPSLFLDCIYNDFFFFHLSC